MTDTEQPDDEATVYRGKDGEWRWTLQAAGNHEVINASTEGYVNKADAIANFKRATGRSHWEESLE